jgi:hypothetical protein
MRGSGLQIERAKPRHADYAVPHADLFCDPNAKVALARFALGGNDDPPHYTKLPSNLDGGLSGLPGTARTDCSLSLGMDIRIRAGEGLSLRSRWGQPSGLLQSLDQSPKGPVKVWLEARL